MEPTPAGGAPGTKMSGGEIAAIIGGTFVVLIIIYMALQPATAAAAPVVTAPVGFSSAQYPNLGNMTQYALDAVDAQASNNLMGFVMNAPGYSSDGNGGAGFASWWLQDIPLYLPGGARDNATFFPKSSYINGNLYLMTRISRAVVDLATTPSWQNTNAPDTVFEMQQAFNGQEMTGL